MRDTRASLEHFNSLLASKEEHIFSQDAVANYEAMPRTPNGKKDLSPLLYLYTWQWLDSVSLLYSRGDLLDDIRSKNIEISEERYLYTADEIEKNKENPYALNFWENMNGAHELMSVYTFLCWFICFGVKDSSLTTLAPYIVPAGRDRLVDTILARYDPSREIAAESGCPKAFQLLDEIIDATDDERIKLVQKHLKNWGKFMSETKTLATLGCDFPKGVKTTKKLLETIHPSYCGYWAWDVALVVKVFSIDDSTFAENPLYPGDLIHYQS